MSVNWEVRRELDEPPEYLPDAELFTIRIHYILGKVEGMAGYIDYCSADQISRIELLAMARELNLEMTTGSSIWWLDAMSPDKGYKEITTDLEALNMAKSVGSSKEMCVCVRFPAGGRPLDHDQREIVVDDECVGIGETCRVPHFKHAEENAENQAEHEEENAADEENLEDILVGGHERRKKNEEDDFHDSDYSFGDEAEEDDIAEVGRSRTVLDSGGIPAQVGVEENLDSDYADSDNLQSCSSTDEENLVTTKPRYSEFNDEVDMRNPQFKIGMKFSSFKQFKDAVKNYGIKNRYVMNFRPNTKKKCKAYCKKSCPFYLWASPMVQDKNTIQIKAGVLEHECPRDHINRHVNADWIARHYLEQFRADTSWSMAGIIQAVKSNQEVEISRLKAYRAKCIAHRIIDGDEESQMVRLQDYRLELMRTHPSSTIIIETNEDVFEGMYVCLAPLRAGFLAGCRRLVSLDGCFLKGLYGGQLLSAVGIDANDCIYPIAWAVVRKENKDNWTWFLQILAQDLRINDSQSWAFMTDRQKGLMPAIAELFPHSEHRYCVRHIHTNFRQTFRGKALKDQLWVCARATYRATFDRAMEKLKEMSLGAYEYMKKIEPKHWSKAYFQTQFKCDILLNNLCEVFNSNIVEARMKGIITTNEMIRTQLMKRIHKRRDAMEKLTTSHCPKIMKKLEKYKQMSWLYGTTWSGGDKYQVLGPEGQFVVNKAEGKCSCRRWQLSGIPCSHAVSVLYYNRERPEDYLDPCYGVNTYMATYRNILNPTHDKDSWPKSDHTPIIPPEPMNQRRGRKTMLRRKEVGEELGFTKGKVCKKGVKMTCSICGATGHNKRFHGSEKNSTGSASGSQPQTGPQHLLPPVQTDQGLTPRPSQDEDGSGSRSQLPDHAEQGIPPPNDHIPAEAATRTYLTNKDGNSNLANKNTVHVVLPKALQKPIVARESQLRLQESNKRGGKRTQSKLAASVLAAQKSQMKQNTIEGNKQGVADKRRKFWLPPGVGGSAGTLDPSKKLA